MGIFNKDENWWLRFSLVSFSLITLASASVINRSVTTERQQLNDSLNYYKKLSDSVLNDRDSLLDENFELNHYNGLQELMLYNLSQENPKYKNLEKDLEKEANSNKYE